MRYKNVKTGETADFDVETDETGHFPMYVYKGGDEWKFVSKWGLNVVNSSEFFRTGHEYAVKFTKPPLEGCGMPYGIT